MKYIAFPWPKWLKTFSLECQHTFMFSEDWSSSKKKNYINIVILWVQILENI